MNEETKKSSVLVLCDFDGTVCAVDMGNEILNRFTGEKWEEIDRAYCANEIGSRDAYTQIASLFTGTKARMLEFASISGLMDPYFSEFYRFCKETGVDIKIVSDGLDFYIDTILKKYNLQDIEFFSNVVLFRDDTLLSIEFPRMNKRCEKCGTCKSGVLKEYRTYYDHVIYVGNGYSDVCPAKDADIVFAKDVLYEKCLQNGMACVPYKNFNDILAFFKEDTMFEVLKRNKAIK